MEQHQPFEAPAGRRAPDGTREYRLHSASGSGLAFAGRTKPQDKTPQALKEAAVQDAAWEDWPDDERRAAPPGLAASGEVPRRKADGSLAMEDDVVRRQVRARREFPYG